MPPVIRNGCQTTFFHVYFSRFDLCHRYTQNRRRPHQSTFDAEHLCTTALLETLSLLWLCYTTIYNTSFRKVPQCHFFRHLISLALLWNLLKLEGCENYGQTYFFYLFYFYCGRSLMCLQSYFNKLVYLQVWEVIWCNCPTKCLCWLAVCSAKGMSEHNISFGLKTNDQKLFPVGPGGPTDQSDSPRDSKSFATTWNTIDSTNVLFITFFR